ncbi:hypothetical protein ACTP13_14370 [Paenibacillus peoriae]|uniref:hypothetical protein n=1 Tax=Paenibacillus peoriae TaxID=59893 RepID=UPI003F997373
MFWKMERATDYNGKHHFSNIKWQPTGDGMGIYMMGTFMAGAIGTSILGSVLDQGVQSKIIASSVQQHI